MATPAMANLRTNFVFFTSLRFRVRSQPVRTNRRTVNVAYI